MISIEEADLDSCRDELTELLAVHLTPRSSRKRFDWFYLENPHGRAKVWVALHSQQGVVGSAAIVPRRMSVAGVAFDACVMADFWVHPQHRVLGPAVKLQRTCIEGARRVGMPIFMDMPQGSMPAIYKRLQIVPRTQIVRHARPLNVDRYLTKFHLPASATAALSGLANRALRAIDNGRMPNGLSVQTVPTEFGSDFTDLYLRLRAHMPVLVDRSASYLNWRYRDHYYLEHRLVICRRGNELVGYVVIALEQATAQVVDLFGPLDDREITQALVLGAMEAARSGKAETMNVPLLADDMRGRILGNLGYRRREGLPLVIEALSKSHEHFAERVYLTYGDVDY